MVLASIIIGLGITHLLSGVGAIIERITGPGGRTRLSVAHACWMGYVFVWLISFWWWQFRLMNIVTVWTMGRYFFIITFAVLMFLLVVILVPREWDVVDDLNDYFLSKRHWFFSVYGIAHLADLVDSLWKGGWAYVFEMNQLVALGFVVLPSFIVGMKSNSITVHTRMAVLVLIWQVVVSFLAFPQLSP